MNTSSQQLGFGLLVAFTLPGFIVLAGIAPFSPTVASWLQPLDRAEASLGAPLYAMLAATTIGMIVSCFRWLLIDHIHRWMGIVPPVWDDGRLPERINAFDYIVANHYRFYQFYANTLIALITVYTVNRTAGTFPLLGVGTDTGMLLLCAVLFAGSRDTLSKYYARTGRLVGQISKKGRIAMTNGNHNDGVGTATSARPRPQVKPPPQPKPETSPSPKPGRENVQR